MRVVVGLGNPGRKYRRTPHNLGMAVVENLAEKWGISLKKSRHLSAKIGEGIIANASMMLIEPLTFMNLSGEALRPLIQSGSFKAQDFFVVCDDINLPLGRLRLRKSGSAGGHKGLLSIIDVLGSDDFPRLRIGCRLLGEEMQDRIEYLLSPMKRQYFLLAAEMIALAIEAIEFLLKEGIDKAMAKFNAINLQKTEG